MLLIAAAVAGFACSRPSHHDGDAILCAGKHRSDRLYGIDAPEMPGACRPGRRCTPGDPYAARDYLARLTNGRSVVCNQVDTDVYGRRIVRCAADGDDLSCAMVASGLAVARYGPLDCGAPHPPPQEPAVRRHYPQAAALGSDTGARTGRAGWASVLAVWLVLVNIAAWAGFAIDKRRSIIGPARRVARIPERRLLVLAALGGSPAAIAAQKLRRHKTRKQPFAARLLMIAGIQAGVAIGLLALLFG